VVSALFFLARRIGIVWSAICSGGIVSLIAVWLDDYLCSAVCLCLIEAIFMPAVCRVTLCLMHSVEEFGGLPLWFAGFGMRLLAAVQIFARFRLNRRAAVLCQVDKPVCRGRLASIWLTLYCGLFAGNCCLMRCVAVVILRVTLPPARIFLR